MNWLNHDKSLREQGVGENDAVRLRKKFFFSDQNVDRNDPVQLNLMYVQVCTNIRPVRSPRVSLGFFSCVPVRNVCRALFGFSDCLSVQFGALVGCDPK